MDLIRSSRRQKVEGTAVRALGADEVVRADQSAVHGEEAETLFTRNGVTFRQGEAVHFRHSDANRLHVAILLGTVSGESGAGSNFGGKIGKGGSVRLALRLLLHRDDVRELCAGEEQDFLSSRASQFSHELFISDLVTYVSTARVMDKVCVLNEGDFAKARMHVSAKTGMVCYFCSRSIDLKGNRVLPLGDEDEVRRRGIKNASDFGIVVGSKLHQDHQHETDKNEGTARLGVKSSKQEQQGAEKDFGWRKDSAGAWKQKDDNGPSVRRNNSAHDFLDEVDRSDIDPEMRRLKIFKIAVALSGVDVNDQSTWPASPNAGASRCLKSPFCSKPARHRARCDSALMPPEIAVARRSKKRKTRKAARERPSSNDRTGGSKPAQSQSRSRPQSKTTVAVPKHQDQGSNIIATASPSKDTSSVTSDSSKLNLAELKKKVTTQAFSDRDGVRERMARRLGLPTFRELDASAYITDNAREQAHASLFRCHKNPYCTKAPHHVARCKKKGVTVEHLAAELSFLLAYVSNRSREDSDMRKNCKGYLLRVVQLSRAMHEEGILNTSDATLLEKQAHTIALQEEAMNPKPNNFASAKETASIGVERSTGPALASGIATAATAPAAAMTAYKTATFLKPKKWKVRQLVISETGGDGAVGTAPNHSTSKGTVVVTSDNDYTPSDRDDASTAAMAAASVHTVEYKHGTGRLDILQTSPVVSTLLESVDEIEQERTTRNIARAGIGEEGGVEARAGEGDNSTYDVESIDIEEAMAIGGEAVGGRSGQGVSDNAPLDHSTEAWFSLQAELSKSRLFTPPPPSVTRATRGGIAALDSIQMEEESYTEYHSPPLGSLLGGMPVTSFALGDGSGEEGAGMRLTQNIEQGKSNTNSLGHQSANDRLGDEVAQLQSNMRGRRLKGGQRRRRRKVRADEKQSRRKMQGRVGDKGSSSNGGSNNGVELATAKISIDKPSTSANPRRRSLSPKRKRSDQVELSLSPMSSLANNFSNFDLALSYSPLVLEPGHVGERGRGHRTLASTSKAGVTTRKSPIEESLEFARRFMNYNTVMESENGRKGAIGNSVKGHDDDDNERAPQRRRSNSGEPVITGNPRRLQQFSILQQARHSSLVSSGAASSAAVSTGAASSAAVSTGAASSATVSTGAVSSATIPTGTATSAAAASSTDNRALVQMTEKHRLNFEQAKPADPATGLPPGWRSLRMIRQSGPFVCYYFSPRGERFRSLKKAHLALSRALGSQHVPPTKAYRYTGDQRKREGKMDLLQSRRKSAQ